MLTPYLQVGLGQNFLSYLPCSKIVVWFRCSEFMTLEVGQFRPLLGLFPFQTHPGGAHQTSLWRWANSVEFVNPIKINIFSWRATLDCLPFKVQLSRRGVLLDNLGCSSCSRLFWTNSPSHFILLPCFRSLANDFPVVSNGFLLLCQLRRSSCWSFGSLSALRVST